jgi:hypothetical protein
MTQRTAHTGGEPAVHSLVGSISLLVAATVHIAAAQPAEGGEVARVRDIGSQRQFWFNAQDLIAASSHIRVLQQRPAKHPQNPLLVADRPWEGTLVQLYSPDVHHDPDTGKWQMWYEGHPGEVLLCTAFSEDGIRWRKPSLGIHEWNGSRDNNIILRTGYWDANCASIVKAPTETDPARRFKLYYWVGPEWFDSSNPLVAAIGNKIKDYKENGHYVAFSADGIHFTPQNDAPVIRSSDFCTVLFDEQSGRYRSYHKIEQQLPGWDVPRRCMSMAESDDGVHFWPSIPVLAPDEADDALAKAQGGVRAEFYGVHVWPYEGFYLGLLWVFEVTRGNPELGRGWDDGRIEPQLIYSADGIVWKRLPVREPFIPHGPAGSFEAGSVYSAGDHPVVVGDEVRFYYFGVSYTHGDTAPKTSLENYSGVGLATLPRDRYVGWQGGTAAGTVLTNVLRFRGRELHLNLDASRGETRVALLAEDGTPLSGYSLDDCQPLSSDGLDQVVRWRGRSDLSALSGKALRLEFSLRHSVLYTWQFR